jgi:hypothetical protein
VPYILFTVFTPLNLVTGKQCQDTVTNTCVHFPRPNWLLMSVDSRVRVSVCVCVCVCARARARACVCVRVFAHRSSHVRSRPIV